MIQQLNQFFSDIKGSDKRIKLLMQSFDGPKELKNLNEKDINHKTGIPFNICSEIIEISKNNT